MSFEMTRDPITDPERRLARIKKICSLNLNPEEPPTRHELEACKCLACMRDLEKLKSS